MTGRTAAAIASVGLALGALGCTNFYEIAVQTPIQAKIDISPFQRVLVAGFLTGGTSAIDANTETARLLRSQLRTKADLRVIDADVLSLVEEVDRRRGGGGERAAGAPTAEEPRIRNERDLEDYEHIFADVDYWKRLGEEFQNPLIVTGSVLFTEIARSGMVSRPRIVTDATGRTTVEDVRQWMDRRGFALAPKFIFIDGRSGTQLYSETFREEALYPTSQNTPALSSYFELMDRLLPGFLSTLSSQKIRGTRILIK